MELETIYKKYGNETKEQIKNRIKELDKEIDELKQEMTSLPLHKTIELRDEINELETEKESLEMVDYIHELNDRIDNHKANRYKGLIRPDRNGGRHYRDEVYYKFIEKNRDDVKLVNTNQYQIVYDNNKDIDSFDFEIELNKPFYENSEKLKNKKSLIKFLENANKVSINPNMFFIPYTFKNDDNFYLLVVNNILENIEAYQLSSFNYLNKQHNVYYIIEANKDDGINELNEFKNHIIKMCQEYTNDNMNLIYDVYNKVDNFKKEKAISKKYNTRKSI